MKRVASVVSLAFAVVMASIAANAATLTLGDASLSGDQLAVPVTVSGSSGGTLELYLGAAEQKDGEPSPSASVATVEIAGDGLYSIVADVTLGTKVAYRAVLGADVSSTATKELVDERHYFWKANQSGLWSDPNNWTASETTLRTLGYPSYGSQFHFQGNQTDTIYVDAAYTGMQGNANFGWSGADLTFIGTIPGAQLGFGGVNAFYNDTHVVLDNVRIVGIANYAVKANSSLTMKNGAYLSTRWWIDISGDNAMLTVCSGCEISASTEWWYGISFSGENAKIVIDDGYVYTPRLRISTSDSSKMPYGIVFKGSNPRLVIAEEFNVHGTYQGAPRMEFIVPLGGFASTPIEKNRSGNYVAMGGDYLDHPGALADNTSKVMFTVSDRSPFFADTLAENIKLFDWSTSNINTDRVLFGTFEDSANNAFSYESDNNQIWVRLTGTGTPFNRSVVSPDISLAHNDETATVIVTATVEEVGDGTTTATCYICDVEHNGRASALRQLGEPVAVTETGTISFSGLGVLGSVASCHVVLENVQGSTTYLSSTLTNGVDLVDSASYTWKANETGYWSDSSKWTCSATDGLPRLGYPSNGGKFHFHGNQTDEVYVDGDYSGFGWNNNFAWDNATVSLLGVSDNASITALSIDIYSHDQMTISNMNFRVGAYLINAGSSLTLLDGATLSTTWQFDMTGTGASLYVGSNCTVNVGVGEDWHGSQFYGDGTKIVIDNGTFNATYVWLGNKNGDAVVPMDGFTFMGANPQFNVKGYFRNMMQSGDTVKMDFEIPVGGFTSVPISKTGSNSDHSFLASASGGKVAFSVLQTSPYLNVRGNFTQDLVAWTRNGTDYVIDTDGITFAGMPREGETMYFTPVQGETKSGIAVSCLGSSGIAIIVR